MNKAEAKRWAYQTAAEFVRHGWDACDWDEKGGADSVLIDDALLDIASMLAAKGPLPTDRKPRT